MRILFWSELFWPYIGGAEVFGVHLIRALQQRGYEFVVLTSQDYLDLPAEAEYEGIHIYRLPFRKALMGDGMDRFFQVRERAAWLKRAFKPDLIHINGVNPSVLFHLETAHAHPAPVLVRMNQEIFSSRGAKKDTLMNRMLQAADWVACVSAAVLDQVRQSVPETIARSSVIYTGLDVGLPLPKTWLDEEPRLLCLGRLVPAKGFDLALTALASVVGRFPNVRLVIAGDGSARPQLEQRVAELGLGKAVEFIGG